VKEAVEDAALDKPSFSQSLWEFRPVHSTLTRAVPQVSFKLFTPNE
jgi:hypothetical protein